MNELFRDTTYDDRSALWKLGFCTGAALCMVGPMLFACLFLTWMYHSGYGEIGSRTSSVIGTVVIVGAIALSVVLLLWFQRRFDFTIRYRILILSEQNELFFADMTRGALLGYYIKQVPDHEKRKYRPKGMHLIFNVLSPFLVAAGRGRYRGCGDMGVVRNIGLFRYNQAHSFVERLLTGAEYALYCEKVLRVEKIKERAAWIEAVLVTQSGEKMVRRTVCFHCTMPDYEQVLHMLKKLEKMI